MTTQYHLHLGVFSQAQDPNPSFLKQMKEAVHLDLTSPHPRPQMTKVKEALYCRPCSTGGSMISLPYSCPGPQLPSPFPFSAPSYLQGPPCGLPLHFVFSMPLGTPLCGRVCGGGKGRERGAGRSGAHAGVDGGGLLGVADPFCIPCAA